MTTTKIKEKFKPNFYEKLIWQKKELVCGIDEVGRACLAGPVVTAAVILKPIKKRTGYYKLLKDSKTLTPEQRLQIYGWLKENSHFAASVINHRIIDQVNIYHATLKSMKRSYFQLCTKFNQPINYILVDAMPLKVDNKNINILYFNKGEDLSMSIAAASIVAKVTRDTIMQRLDNIFPEYYFYNHKGYSTIKHKKALNKFGRTIIHRSSFLRSSFL